VRGSGSNLRIFLRLKNIPLKNIIMPSQPVGKPLVAETLKERCSATTKEMTRCQLAKNVGSHFCPVHTAKVATKVATKATALPVRQMVTRSHAK